MGVRKWETFDPVESNDEGSERLTQPRNAISVKSGVKNGWQHAEI